MKRQSVASLLWSPPTRRRSGLALLVVLAALAIVSAIGMTLLRLSLMHHRQAERESFTVQTRWLAEAGLDHAAARLKADPNFAGSTWSVPASDLDGRHAAKVTLAIRPIENAPQGRSVTVTADFPADSPQRTRTRVVRQVDLTL